MRFSAIDFWVPLLETLKKEVMAKTRVKPDKLRIITLGTELEKYTTPRHTREQARKQLNLSQDALMIGILGRIDPASDVIRSTRNIR